jgi:hypothetical protein
MRELKRSPIRISGDWQPVAFVGHLDWTGTVSADEPITGLALARDVSGTHWSSAGRTGSSSLVVRLSVRPVDSVYDRHVVEIGLTVQPAGRKDGSGMALWTSRCRLTSTAPLSFSLNHHHTGNMTWFADARVDTGMQLGALFVCETDTQSARNHLWHLREDVDGPTAALSVALNRGRTGSVLDS